VFSSFRLSFPKKGSAHFIQGTEEVIPPVTNPWVQLTEEAYKKSTATNFNGQSPSDPSSQAGQTRIFEKGNQRHGWGSAKKRTLPGKK
jgi:hypothetical protein